MLNYKKFSISELKSLKSTVHVTEGTPILYKLLTKPISEMIQRRINQKIKPNSITWLGFVSMFSSFVITMAYDPFLIRSSKALCAFNALCLLVYILTDSLDGIHSRKTKSCSPLGKILDHFVDSANLVFCFVSLVSSLRLGLSFCSYMLLICLATGFYSALLSEKYSGILKFSVISGASEGLYFIVFSQILNILFPNLLGILISNHPVLFVFCCTFYTISIFLFLISDFLKSKRTKGISSFFLEIFRFVFTGISLIPVLYFARKPFLIFSGILLFQFAFSICYLNQSVANITNGVFHNKSYLVQTYCLILFGFSLLIGIRNESFYSWILLLSSLTFSYRSMYILLSISKILNVKLFTTKF